jgi:NADP-dependent aldehyde dehydrogenase
MFTENLIAGERRAAGIETLRSTDPISRMLLPGQFTVATATEIDETVLAAWQAWRTFKLTTASERAVFLRTIATEIEKLGDTLVERAMSESGLPEGRILGERGRTCNQLRLFADLLEEGSWVDAVIDEALPDRQPMPRTDLRKMSVALGPVAVFTASNFPLAFSTAGGDTASALAAGCPVIVKAHPSHLGTNALVAEAITKAVQKCNLPAGTFSSLQGSVKTGQTLVQHPLLRAVGFTGSFRGGKALFDLANQRPDPIPVYAEMGSNNPIFVLPKKLAQDASSLATSLAGSVNLGAGQFCTNPGIVVVQQGKRLDAFLSAMKKAFAELSAATMLNEGIFQAYEKDRASCANTRGVTLLFEQDENTEAWKGRPAYAQVAADVFIKNKNLQEEVFGPFTLLVICEDDAQFYRVADQLQGQLTATIMGNDDELANAADLLEILTQKAGRVIFNGVPTGVEVCAAMHHGGPYPATSNALFTSVGTDAIKRFVRPVTFQNVPDALLPPALKANNPLQIWRTVNGTKTKE